MHKNWSQERLGNKAITLHQVHKSMSQFGLNRGNTESQLHIHWVMNLVLIHISSLPLEEYQATNVTLLLVRTLLDLYSGSTVT